MRQNPRKGNTNILNNKIYPEFSKVFQKILQISNFQVFRFLLAEKCFPKVKRE